MILETLTIALFGIFLFYFSKKYLPTVAKGHLKESEDETQIQEYSFDIEKALQKAKVFFDKKDYDGAIKIYLDIIDHDKENLKAYLALEKIYKKKEDTDHQMEVLKKITEIDPNNAAALNNLGLLLCGIHDFNEAVPIFKRAAAIDPLPHRLVNLAVAYEKKGDDEEKIKVLEKLAKLTNDSEHLFILADAYLGSKNTGGAQKIYKRILELNPKNEEAKQALEDLG